jgi:tRNA nucleotidyltransferase (CCA-adding enzyme)
MRISARQLRRKFLGDKYNPVIFKKGRDRGIYAVGGYVRDTLRGARSQDRDFVVSGDLMSFVDEVRDIFGGTIVKFKKDNMVRLALPNGLTFDFSAPMGTIEEDLSGRDFTINALSWSPERGIIDMHRGIEDLAKNRICMISESNLISDPLRLLRAYRFAAELGGSIEKRTRDAIKTLHNRIENVSSERITLELFHLLNSKRSSRYLRAALRDGVLADILSLSDKVLGGNIRGIYKLEERLLEDLPAGIKALLDRIFSQNLTYKGLLCLELLLQGNVRRARKVRMSSNLVKRVQISTRGVAELKRRRSPSKGELFDIFVLIKDAVPDVLIISGHMELFREYRKFRRIMKGGFLQSKDIIEIMDLCSGPLIGKSILALRRAEFEGIVRSRAEAVDFIRKRASGA